MYKTTIILSFEEIYQRKIKTESLLKLLSLSWLKLRQSLGVADSSKNLEEQYLRGFEETLGCCTRTEARGVGTTNGKVD